MDYEKIDLTVEYKGRQLDLRISKSLTWSSLEKVLQDQAISTKLGLPLENEGLQFAVKNKLIHIEKNDLLAYYPIGNGDILEIVDK